jgi:hypothetical protein
MECWKNWIVHVVPGAHPASYWVGFRCCFLNGKATRDVKLTTYQG